MLDMQHKPSVTPAVTSCIVQDTGGIASPKCAPLLSLTQAPPPITTPEVMFGVLLGMPVFPLLCAHCSGGLSLTASGTDSFTNGMCPLSMFLFFFALPRDPALVERPSDSALVERSRDPPFVECCLDDCTNQ